jgi:hypothetical protein
LDGSGLQSPGGPYSSGLRFFTPPLRTADTYYFRDQSLAACEYCKPGGNGFTTLGPGAEPGAE